MSKGTVSPVPDSVRSPSLLVQLSLWLFDSPLDAGGGGHCLRVLRVMFCVLECSVAPTPAALLFSCYRLCLT